MPQGSLPDGRPRPLVLLHGLGQSPIAWQDFVSALGAGRPMHAPWMKGLRPKDAVGFDLGDAAATVADELELQGIRRADVLGVSIGGSVALRLAVERPELVGRLVLAGALVRPSRTALSMQKAALRLVPKQRLLEAGVSRERMMGAIDALRTLDASGSLRAVRARTLVVVGSRDRAGLPAAQQLAREIPDARLEVIDGGGGLLNTEAPEALADLTQRFLHEPEQPE